jgi:rhamnosyltransferase
LKRYLKKKSWNKQTSMDSLKQTKISVIIPTLNAEAYIKPLIIALQNQSLKPFETIAIDSSSLDKTVEIAESCGAKVIIINKSDFDHGKTRNEAARIASGDILVFMTQDSVPADSSFLENLISPLSEPYIALSYARQLPKEDANPIEKFARNFNYPAEAVIKDRSMLPIMGIKTFFCSNAASAVRKREFEELGCFPSQIITSEDMFFAFKVITAGYKIAYQPSARVLHSHNYSLAQQFKRYFDIGVFFNRNKELLNFTKMQREGNMFIKEQTGFLIKNRFFLWIPYGYIDAAMRFAGYRLGRIEYLMPAFLRKILSMNKGFWG